MLLIPAYAKVNLCLAVRGRRPDGFHEIDSVAVAVDWHDLVGIEARAAPATAVRLRVTDGGGGEAPAGEDNLAARAAAAVAQLVGPMAVDVWLDKRIPSRAGLGGGSADAAAVLRGSDRWSGLDDQTRLAMAASLGSDVPVALGCGAQRMRGRGEVLDAVPAPTLFLAIAIAGTSDTTATYAATEEVDFEDAGRVDHVLQALAAGGLPDDGDLGSGLEPAACRANPELDERLVALRAAIPQVRWHLTGSGGAAFALAPDPAGAAEMAAAARHAGFVGRACRTVAAVR
ncbi:MAG TPA: 4-(cytidine 5'-diphospho)-2-C-methyl-D-erythritol kinase [Candidatus Dormibacteraeota bacterium]|jgi:4-diphosphocytidyl-2-C-methyl-D-erythritol kinase